MATDTRALKRIVEQVKQREKSIELFLEKLSHIYDRSVADLLQELRDKKPGAANAARIISELDDVMADYGFSEAFAEQLSIYRDEITDIEKELARLGVRDDILTGVDVETVEALAQFNSKKIASTFERMIGDSESLIFRSYILGEPVNLETVKEQVSGRVFSQVKTEMNTAMATFARTVTAKKGIDAGFELYLYIGPEDDVTRPFCDELLDKDPPIYTLEEISAMDNEQGMDVFSSGGGYNCRHQWRPVTVEMARNLGYEA